MAKLKQTFRNATDRPVFVNLELSTSRHRLLPGDELILSYDTGDRPSDDHGALVRTELISGPDGVELVVWSSAQTLSRPDGTPAPLDYDPA
jgi:hypothetical protein